MHLFDTRSTTKDDRSLLAIHFPASRVLSIFQIARVPAEETLRVYPVFPLPAISACAISAFRHSVLDLLIVNPDGTLSILTHGTRIINVKLGPRPLWATLPEYGLESVGSDDMMPVDDLDVSMQSAHSIIDKEKVVAVGEPLHNSFTIHFENGSTTRSKIIYMPRDQLTHTCFIILSFALTESRAFELHVAWLHKISELGGVMENDEEWLCFVDTLCQLLNVELPNHRTINSPPQPGTWEALAYSTSNARFKHDPVLELLDSPFEPYRRYDRPPPVPADDIDPCLMALHLLAESYKLKMDAVHAFLPRLARLLIALGRAVRPEWSDYWVRIFPEHYEGWVNYKRESEQYYFLIHTSFHLPYAAEYPTRLRPQPPDLYLYLFSRLVDPMAKPGWNTMNHLSQMYQFEPALQYGKTDPLQDVYRLFSVWECFTDSAVSTARKRAENAMQAMVRLGLTNDDLDRMPPGLAQPIREALRTCQSLPSGDWSAAAYRLVLRPDLSQMVTGDASHMTSRDSFRQVDKHLVRERFR